MSVNGQGNSGQPGSGKPEESFLTLDPIRTDGPDSINPDGIPEITSTRLVSLEINADNTFHEVTIHKADDLFRCADADGPLSSPIPATGTITAAGFAINFADSPEPRRVTVRLPDTIILERPTDADAIFRWLEKNRFRIQHKLTCLLLLLGLSLIAATASPLDDDETGDDCDEDNPEDQTTAFTS